MPYRLFLPLLLYIISPFAWSQTLPDVLPLDMGIPSPHYELRAVWLTTYGGLDWPRIKATTPQKRAQQQDELCHMLDQLQRMGINTIVFQTRIRGTVVYPSSIEPWDECLTGHAGKTPGYDPLAFAIDQCHRRGMEIHAWIVVYPIESVATAKKLGAQATSRRVAKLCQRCNDRWMMDPGHPETPDYVASICSEIAHNYDVDGISLDYVRYPEKEIPFDDRSTYRRYANHQPRAAWRRQNIDRCVKAVHDAVRYAKPWIKLSCSPVGKYADLPRFSSSGWNARDAVAQDAAHWVEKGWMDLLLPMMYFTGNHFFPFAADWQNRSANKIVAPGLAAYMLSPTERNWSLDVITRELNYLRSLKCGGQAYFRARFLTDNVKGIGHYLQNIFYRERAAVPPMTWIDSIPPAKPLVKAKLKGINLHIDWTPADEVHHLNLYLCTDSAFNLHKATLLQQRITETSFDVVVLPSPKNSKTIGIVAVDRFGNESEPTLIRIEPTRQTRSLPLFSRP